MTALAFPVLHADSAAPAGSAALAAPSPLLLRCLLLAVLLHVWLVLLLGNTPGGTAAPGEGVWGAINISLRGPPTPGATQVQPPQPLSPNGPPGPAPEARWGGTVREVAPSPEDAAGAARLGEWAREPARPPLAALPPTETLTAAPDALPSQSLPALQPMPPAVSTLRATPAPAALPAPTPIPALPPVLPLPAVPLADGPAPPALAAPIAEPAPARVLQPRVPAAPAAPAVAPLPSTPSATAPALPDALPALRAPIAAPERQLASPLQRETPRAAAAQPLESLPSTAPAVAPATTLPAAAPAPALEAPLRQLGGSIARPDAATAAATAAPLAPVEPMAPIAPSALGSTPLPALSGGPAAAASPMPPAPGPALTPGAPDAGARTGHDVATPPGAAASAPPRLNLQLARPRGGELSRIGGVGALPVLPRPPEVESKLAEDIRKSARDDCRNAYAGAGLLAVIPLAVDAVRKDGCKW